jgi:hypothetical protein
MFGQWADKYGFRHAPNILVFQELDTIFSLRILFCIPLENRWEYTMIQSLWWIRRCLREDEWRVVSPWVHWQRRTETPLDGSAYATASLLCKECITNDRWDLGKSANSLSWITCGSGSSKGIGILSDGYLARWSFNSAENSGLRLAQLRCSSARTILTFQDTVESREHAYTRKDSYRPEWNRLGGQLDSVLRYLLQCCWREAAGVKESRHSRQRTL